MKLTEIAAGPLLLSNRFVAVALVIIAPVLVNIAGFHAFYAPSGLAVPIVLIAAELWLAWKHRAAFAPMFVARPAQVQAEASRRIAAAA